MLRCAIVAAVASLALVAAFAQTGGQEGPAGLLLSSGQAELRRAGRALPLAAREGDILFPGDIVETGEDSATLQYCPASALYELQPRSSVRIGVQNLETSSGEVRQIRRLETCLLPEVSASGPASRRNNGASLIREVLETPPIDEGFEARLSNLAPAAAGQLRAELEEIERLESSGGDMSARVARAVVFEQHGLAADAANEYRSILQVWPNAAWARSRLFVHEEAVAKSALRGQRSRETALRGEGKTYALLIGISSYQDPRIQDLQFAHEDATLFEKHLKSPRGGALPAADVLVLLNEHATTAAVRTAIDSFLKVRAGPQDIVLIFVAAHGTVDEKTGQGYIVTYDSDPEDLSATALSMGDLQDLVQRELSGIRRALIYADVCHAGKIGTIDTRRNRIHRDIDQLAEAEGEVGGMTASRPGEISFEGPQYGGGHGAFSYFLLQALNGAADYDRDGVVTVDDVIDYVRTRVEEGTFGRQHPRDIGDLPNALAMARLEEAGIQVQAWKPPEPGQEHQVLAGAGELARGFASPAPPPRRRGEQDLTADLKTFDEALQARRILPSDFDSAFSALSALRRQLSKEEYLEEANRLRVALEIEGQQVLLRYLKGEQAAQDRGAFVAGAAYFEAAKLLTPESMLADARGTFCLGRAAIFAKQYPQAVGYLELAARLDPEGAYTYNALGIAYLEQGEFDRAQAAFEDAIRAAPNWAYPLHNLALVHIQTGSYEGAIAAYQRAIELAPEFAYLPYNLGLVYQRVNQVRPAERAYQDAIAKAENLSADLRPRHLALAHNAMGYLMASTRRPRQAEQRYRQALEIDGALLEPRHNLAVLLAEQGKTAQDPAVTEAIGLWRANLERDGGYLPSRLSLARTLARFGQTKQAIEEYDRIVRDQPDYIAARVALAELQAEAGEPGQALWHLREALDRRPANAAVLEKIGDVETSRGNEIEAMKAYEAALQNAVDGRDKKRLRKRLKR
jgi:tetratricopeptide (TPR) repeat protein